VVRFHPAARAELRRAVERYNSEAPGIGAALATEVERAVQRIGEFPQLGSPYLVGTRRVILRRFPFSIVYRLEGPDVVIVALAHHRRRPGYWRD
jgi:plasmid stabilization system protein ParE